MGWKEERLKQIQSIDYNSIGTTPTQSKDAASSSGVINTLDSITSGLKAFNENPISKGVNALGLGLQKGTGVSFLNKLLNPEVEAQYDERRKEYPIISKAGEIGGYALPFSAAGKVVSKLPGLATKATTLTGKIGQGAAKGALEGIIVGGAMGGIDAGIDYAQGKGTAGEIGQKALTDAAVMGTGGAFLGGLVPAVGAGINKLGTKFATNQALNRINQTYQNLSQQGISGFNPNVTPPPTVGNLPNTQQFIVSGQQTVNKTLKEKALSKWDNFYRNWVDNASDLNKFSKAAGPKDTTYQTAMNAKKVSGTVEYIINKNLVDKNGNNLGEGLKTIAQDIPKDKELAFWDYMLHKHNVARVREGKPIDFTDANGNLISFTSQDSQNMANQYAQANPEFVQLSKRVNDFLTKFSDAWRKDTGLTTDTLLAELRKKYPDYIPTQRQFSELEKGSVNGARKGFVDQPSTIDTATGSDRNVINPLENIMNLVNRTVRTARRNEIGQKIIEAIQKDPNKLKGYAEIVPDNFATPQEWRHFQKGDMSLDNMVTVRVGGKEVNLMINNKEFLDTINGAANSNMDSKSLLNFSNKLFKGLITQYNPIFAVRNVARDIPSSYIYGSTKNPFKFGADLYRASKEMLKKNSTLYEQYQALGGKSSNFFSPAESTLYKEAMLKPNGIKELPKTVLKKIEGFNNFTETLPRFAEYQRVIRAGGTPQEALYKAGEVTVNFARGGTKAKNIDAKLVPYLNASIQGLDRFARGVINNLGGMAIKGLTAITAPTIIQEVWNQTIDPEGYKALDNRTKDNYFVFATGSKDAPFIKVPKSRELAVLFSSLFQRLYRASKGEENSFKGFSNTVATNFSPTNPIENNMFSPIYNLKSNKDFADRPIVPEYMKQLSPGLQYDEKTSALAKEIGEKANLSPKQIDYIIKSYTGVIGQLGIPAMAEKGNAVKAIKTQFVSDPAYSNQSITDFYDNLNKLRTAAADRNAKEKLPSKFVTPEEKARNTFEKRSETMSKIRKSVKNGTEEEKKDAQIRINKIAANVNDVYKNLKLPSLKK
jgi:hypothetical protein